jgi:hypothetical protein
VKLAVETALAIGISCEDAGIEPGLSNDQTDMYIILDIDISQVGI